MDTRRSAAKVRRSEGINPPAAQIIIGLALLNLGDTTTSRAQKQEQYVEAPARQIRNVQDITKSVYTAFDSVSLIGF